MSPPRELSSLSYILLISSLVGLAVIVPNQLRQHAPEDVDQRQTPYEYIAPTPESDRVYDNHASTSRPLFVKNRRAGPSRSSTDSELVPDLGADSIKIEAVIGGANGYSAGLRVAAQNSINWVREGQRIQNWTVTAIRVDGVRLEDGDETMELTLYPKRRRIAGE